MADSVRCAQLPDAAEDSPVPVGAPTVPVVGAVRVVAPAPVAVAVPVVGVPGSLAGADRVVGGRTGETGVDRRLVLDAGGKDGAAGMEEDEPAMEVKGTADADPVAGPAVAASGTERGELPAVVADAVGAVPPGPPAVEQDTETNASSSARNAMVRRIDLRSRLGRFR